MWTLDNSGWIESPEESVTPHKEAELRRGGKGLLFDSVSEINEVYEIIAMFYRECLRYSFQWPNQEYYSSDESYAMESGSEDDEGNRQNFGMMQWMQPLPPLAPS